MAGSCLDGRQFRMSCQASAELKSVLVKHGAAVNFILWAGVHGGMFVLSNRTSGWRRQLASAPPKDRFVGSAGRGLRVLVCFSAVSFSGPFFRVEDLGQIVVIIGRMMEWVSAGAPMQLALGFYRIETVVLLVLVPAAAFVT